MLTKKQDIIEAATRLFAYQGFEGTTTRQIIVESGTSDPLLYYHFKNKDELYTQMVDAAFKKYFSRLQYLPNDTSTEFEIIENMIQFYFDLVKKIPDKIHLVIATCSAKMNDSRHICTRNTRKQRRDLTSFLSDCLKAGRESGEFVKVPIRKTESLIVAVINGKLCQRVLGLDKLQGMDKTADN